MGQRTDFDLFDRDRDAFWKKIKRDWYDLDFMYLRDHPDFEAFRRYESMEDLRNRYMDFFPPDAFEKRREFIIAFYREGRSMWSEGRPIFPQRSWSALSCTPRRRSCGNAGMRLCN